MLLLLSGRSYPGPRSRPWVNFETLMGRMEERKKAPCNPLQLTPYATVRSYTSWMGYYLRGAKLLSAVGNALSQEVSSPFYFLTRKQVARISSL